MAHPIAIGGVHHLRLTVTDVNRSRAFYTSLLGFDVAAEMPPASDPSYDAVNAIDGGHQPYLVAPPANSGDSKEAAAATAAFRVLVGFPDLPGLFPTQVSTLQLPAIYGRPSTYGLKSRSRQGIARVRRPTPCCRRIAPATFPRYGRGWDRWLSTISNRC